MSLWLKNIVALNMMLVFCVQGISIQQLSVPMFMEKYTTTDCIQCTQDYPFHMTPFPLHAELNVNFPDRGHFKPVFILKIPQATVLFYHHWCSGLNYVFFNNSFITETQIRYFNWFEQDIFEIDDISALVKPIEGRVAVLSHHFPDCYGHWIFDILGQLAMLEIHNVEYDYLCVPYFTKYMKESLEVWGIDPSKIIPLTQNTGIQADSIIMVTPVTKTDLWDGTKANYNMDFVLQYIRNKLLSNMKSLDESSDFSNKVFVSRKSAPSRTVPNEDEVFALFEKRGFQRYELTSLSFAQQVALFYNAQAVVSFVGSGSTNIMFCRPGTHYIEIVQNTVDATFFYEADIFKLRCSHINDSTLDDLVNSGQFTTSARTLPLHIVENFLMEHPDL